MVHEGQKAIVTAVCLISVLERQHANDISIWFVCFCILCKVQLEKEWESTSWNKKRKS